jgi:hypothetical protein
LDSCSLLKLVIAEPESRALKTHLAEQANQGLEGFVSELTKVEMHRTLFRRGANQDRHKRVDDVLANYSALPLPEMLEPATGFLIRTCARWMHCTWLQHSR